jgi:hypothetical protein
MYLGRAWKMAGDLAKSRKAYEDFFAFWKDADPDIPILGVRVSRRGRRQFVLSTVDVADPAEARRGVGSPSSSCDDVRARRAPAARGIETYSARNATIGSIRIARRTGP